MMEPKLNESLEKMIIYMEFKMHFHFFNFILKCVCFKKYIIIRSKEQFKLKKRKVGTLFRNFFK